MTKTMANSSTRTTPNQDYRYQIVDNFTSERRSLGCWSSPSVKVVQMCVLGIAIPLICIVLPVYARTVLYSKISIPISASEMRLLNGSISTVWCKGQKLNMNTSFDAYLMEEKPTIIPKAQKLSMVRHFELDDDVKEYWGFYLLQDSQVTAIICASHLGASVMLVKGMEHLKYCTYVGSESSEELDITDPISFKNASAKTDESEWPYLRSRKRLPHRVEKLPLVRKERAEDSSSAILNQLNKISKSLPVVESILFDNITKNASNDVHIHKPEEADNSEFAQTLTEDVGMDEDAAFEEQIDRISADHETEKDGRSSESVSSTSSSEEAMRRCQGVIITQPIVPGGSCNSTDESPNIVTYEVKESGYYYFVFANGNEQVMNKISVQFGLQKSIYNVSGAISTCYNSSNCSFPLSFASNERVIIFVHDSEENEDKDEYLNRIFSVQSTCEPRTPIYLVFGLSLPLIVILWAFR